MKILLKVDSSNLKPTVGIAKWKIVQNQCSIKFVIKAVSSPKEENIWNDALLILDIKQSTAKPEAEVLLGHIVKEV